MTTDSPNSPIATVADGVGPRATEAFAAIGNQTRLAILLALWRAYDPLNEGNAVQFSDLRESVGLRDSGQFTYHLNQLQGQFIRKTDGGYQLRQAGLKIVQAIIASAGFEDPTFDLVEIGTMCQLCGAPVAATYRNETLYMVCTGCSGFYEGDGDQPETFLTGMPLDPAAVSERTPEELVHAAKVRANNTIKAMTEGVCEKCAGVMTTKLLICEDHTETGVCSNCHRRVGLMVKFRCGTCKASAQVPPRTLIVLHPAVLAFYYAHGVLMQYEVKDFESILLRDSLVSVHRQALISTDPVRIEVTIEYEGDGLRLTLDENLDVVDIAETD